MGSQESRLSRKEHKNISYAARAAAQSWKPEADIADYGPPPQYTPTSPDRTTFPQPSRAADGSRQRTPSYIRAPIRQETMENALVTLKTYDTVFLVDDSLSMRGQRWEEARQALSTLADLAGQYDSNGIDIYFLNNVEESLHNATSSKGVNEVFTRVIPQGATPTGDRLETLLHDYMDMIEKAKEEGRKSQIKKINYIVITDGEATDDPASVIIAVGKRLDKGNWPISQIGIQFVQIGNSKEATAHLRALDDELKNETRDMVDTTPYVGRITQDVLIKVLLGGVNRLQDKQSNSHRYR